MPLHPNAIILAKELSKAGWKKANIAGKLGNFQLESGFNPVSMKEVGSVLLRWKAVMGLHNGQVAVKKT